MVLWRSSTQSGLKYLKILKTIKLKHAYMIYLTKKIMDATVTQVSLLKSHA